MNDLKEKLGTMRVLVVDDEPALCDIWQWNLTKLGFREVVTAGSGHEAVQSLESCPCDLVITDVRMPNGNGLELLGHLDTLKDPPAAIFVTGYADLSREEALHMGALDLLSKPVNNATLEEVLRRWIAGKSSQAS